MALLDGILGSGMPRGGGMSPITMLCSIARDLGPSAVTEYLTEYLTATDLEGAESEDQVHQENSATS